MDVRQAHNTISLLVGAWLSHRMYPAGHPSRDQKARDCHEQLALLLMGKSPLRIGLVEGTLFIEEHLFADPHIAEAEAVDIFETLKIDGIELVRGLSKQELEDFFSLTTDSILNGRNDIDIGMSRAGIHHLRIVTLLQENEKPRTVYNSAIKAVDLVFQDIQSGRIPSTDAIRRVSKNMVQSVLRQEHALFALSQIKDYDNYTFNHSVNVGIIALTVGRACGMHPQKLQLLAFGGMVHDIGKLKIPLEIITKPGRLTHAEFEQVRHHPGRGVEVINQIDDVPQEVIDMVHFHHLHYNREGYPQHSGRAISPLVDVVTIADHYDAMTTHRSYQKPVPPREAIRRMTAVSGKHLHPELLSRFIRHLGEYPVGSLIRLTSSEIALVTGFGPEGNSHLKLRLLFSVRGNPVDEIVLLDLLPDEHDRIIGDVDPLSRGIDITRYFD
jgi:HD-GYP domain-containing protein (c-di-GMP phosphodiesterase class II)